jgi:hypothetical protein
VGVNEFLVSKVLGADECLDGVVGLDVEHVLYGTAF